MKREFRRRLISGIFLTLISSGLHLSLLVFASVAAAPENTTFYVSPVGSGSVCSQTNPCSKVNTALSLASSGSHIYLLEGSYPVQTLNAYTQLNSISENVVVEPAPGANPVVAGFDMKAKHVTLKNLHVHNGFIFFRLGSDHGRLEKMLIDGSGAGRHVSIRASNITIIDSVLTGNIDGDEIGLGEYTKPEDPAVQPPIHDIVITRNRIGPAVVGPNNDHVDCIQSWGGTQRLTITKNIIYGCANSEIILKGDVNSDLDTVLIENNFMQKCASGTSGCGYYVLYVYDAKFKSKNVTVRNNTIDGGMAITSALTNFSFVGNVIKNYNGSPYGQCGSYLQHNLIGSTPCKAYPSTNKIGTPDYGNAAVLDYHLKSGSPGIDFGVPGAASDDYDSQKRDGKADVGADEYVSGATAVIPPPAAPPATSVIAPPAPENQTGSEPNITNEPTVTGSSPVTGNSTAPAAGTKPSSSAPSPLASPSIPVAETTNPTAYESLEKNLTDIFKAVFSGSNSIKAGVTITFILAILGVIRAFRAWIAHERTRHYVHFDPPTLIKH